MPEGSRWAFVVGCEDRAVAGVGVAWLLVLAERFRQVPEEGEDQT